MKRSRADQKTAFLRLQVSFPSIIRFICEQPILQPIVLRRTKDMKVKGKLILDLPPCHTFTDTLTFSPAENLFYQAVWSNAKSDFKASLKQGGATSVFILEKLLRVRQTCDHLYLYLLSQMGNSSSVNPSTLNKQVRNSFLTT